MNNAHYIKVLWIDDEPQDGLKKQARRDHKIEIEVATSVDEGLSLLQNRDKSYEAIILDANCAIKEGDLPNLNALTYAIVNLYRLRIDIPWFVYTAGGERWKEILPYLIPNDAPWLKQQYYDKPDDAGKMLNDISEAVGQFNTTKIKLKYPHAFRVYEGQDLIELLISMESNDNFDRDNTIPGKVRLIVDWICNYMSQKQIIPFDFQPSKITSHSMFFGKKEMQSVVPIYLQGVLHFLVDYSNDGNHRFLDTCESIRSGDAPYTNRAAVFALLNLLNWLSNLPYDNQDKMDEMAKAIVNIYLNQKERK